VTECLPDGVQTRLLSAMEMMSFNRQFIPDCYTGFRSL
jgi:hypothetical protein